MGTVKHESEREPQNNPFQPKKGSFVQFALAPGLEQSMPADAVLAKEGANEVSKIRMTLSLFIYNPTPRSSSLDSTLTSHLSALSRWKMFLRVCALLLLLASAAVTRHRIDRRRDL